MSQNNSRSRPPKRHDSFSNKKGELLMPGSAAAQVRKGAPKIGLEENKSNNGSNKSNPRSIQSGKNGTSEIKARAMGKSPNKRKIITGSKLKQREGKQIETKTVKEYVPHTPQQQQEEHLLLDKLTTSERRRRANSQKNDSDRSNGSNKIRQNSIEPKLNVSEFRKLEASNHIEESLKEDLTKFSEPDSNQPD